MVKKRYCNFSLKLVEPRQRSIRINGLATCIRLEEIYWEIIEVLARQDSVSVGKLLSNWSMEMDLTGDNIKNFTAYVRVVCVVQLARRVETMIAEEGWGRLSKGLMQFATR
ncbi:hypothetical protein AWB80_02714 [Caballeronia pedi]|uniref:Ribbon-helix-helix domain-containing protein n=1 Tax=Caballeronia pedi TaxID=1777141 RepID=A0A158AV56_9BURK|nr:ribbon-helix-helix domain-containing protein [Caballeronia pedi]SAK61828.1 hypothetical protein AWB80_02714 [Caballeronia pedi]